jgi:pimeloyl-ACP methyl ester carboxylesterase
VLLLHGYPQTHAMWHLVAPTLAGDFTIVATVLRGYGDSSKPFGEEDHSTYSKRAMAADQAAGGWGTPLETFAPEALAEYERCFDAATIHASCEGYRAASSIDLIHDEKDWDEARKVEQPLLALWGGRGVMEKSYDVEAVWREYATDVTGKPLDAGHFLAEERPKETTRELRNFLKAGPV